MKARGPLPPFAPDDAYYDHVSRGYDLIAASYDRVEAANAVGRRLRRRVQNALFRTFRPGQRVLEIGCGTGIEALALAERGVGVVATDLSADMVGVVERKARAQGLTNVQARQMAAHEVGELRAEFGSQAFDGAYSHGGVLNMDPGIDAFASAIPWLLRPSARLVCSVVNQASLFEVLFYPFVLRPRKAFRRLGNDVPIPITRLEGHRTYVVPTRFYSPRSFLAKFDGSFALRRLEGLQIFLPPWNLSDYVDRFAPLARAAEAVEERLSDKRPFRSWGSLFLAELERVNGGRTRS